MSGSVAPVELRLLSRFSDMLGEQGGTWRMLRAIKHVSQYNHINEERNAPVVG